MTKPRLSLARIVQMNIGFFGLQFSFGLQQSNMGTIYNYLGADEGNTLLWLAGPMTGLLFQPVIGVLSDRTVTRIGRRTPYFLIGVVIDPDSTPHVMRAAFLIGATLSLGSILGSVTAVSELPLDENEIARKKAQPMSAGTALAHIRDAIVEIPPSMRRLAAVMRGPWFAIFVYWQFIVFAIARRLFGGDDAAAVREATLVNGQNGAFVNFVAFLAAFAMVPLVKRYGARRMHAVCVPLAGSRCSQFRVPAARQSRWSRCLITGSVGRAREGVRASRW